MGVGHEQPTVPIHGQATRPIDVQVGGRPVSEELAVAVENLDAVGQVGNIEVILAVERGHARLVQPTRLRTMHAPDEVGGGVAVLVATGEKARRDSCQEIPDGET